MSQIPPVYRTGHGLDDELRQRVRGQGNAVLATIDQDGSPQLTELLYLLDEEDRLCLPTPHSTRKVRNIAARPLVTAFISLDRGWASCTGIAEVVVGEEAQLINRRIRERLLTADGLATMGRLLAAHEDTTIRITPDRWLSWSPDGIMPWLEAHDDIDLASHPLATWWRDLSTS